MSDNKIKDKIYQVLKTRLFQFYVVLSMMETGVLYIISNSQETLTILVGVVAQCYQQRNRFVVLITECHNFHKHVRVL